MKSIKTAALTALVMVGPMAIAGNANAQTRRDVREARQDVREERRDVRDARQNVREARQAQRWNQRQHNGYYVNGRFYRGAPPAWAQARNDYRPARQAWRRGERLPSYYRTQYREVDWRRSHYRQPPRGYHYVRDDNSGEVLLVALTTGIILSILASQ